MVLIFLNYLSCGWNNWKVISWFITFCRILWCPSIPCPFPPNTFLTKYNLLHLSQRSFLCSLKQSHCPWTWEPIYEEPNKGFSSCWGSVLFHFTSCIFSKFQVIFFHVSFPYIKFYVLKVQNWYWCVDVKLFNRIRKIFWSVKYPACCCVCNAETISIFLGHRKWILYLEDNYMKGG